MPYCPKCDMEFVDGIRTCSDCGAELLASREEADAIRRQAANQQIELELEAMMQFAEAAAGEQEQDAQADNPSEDAALKQETERAAGHVYIKKRQRYEDMLSSISAFLLVGGIFCAFSLLCFTGIIKLPLESGPFTMFKIALIGLGIACLVVAAITKRSADNMANEADKEDALTDEIITWFAAQYTASQLDQEILKADETLSGMELELKRFELIQDYLITQRDLPDPDYVDFLCEELYERIYE